MLQTLETVIINPILGAGALRDLLWTFANGTLQRVDIITDNPNGGGSTVFDILLNGATIFPGGVGRPSIASGASSCNVQGLTDAVVRGDKITISAATLPAGTVGGKLYVILTFDDALGAGGFSSAPPIVISQAIAAPPGAPAAGDAYLVPAGATGAWAGKTDNVAVYSSGAWVFYVPLPKQLLFVEDDQRFLEYTAGAWAVLIPRVADIAIAPGIVPAEGQVLMIVGGQWEARTISPTVVSGEAEQDIAWSGLNANLSVTGANTLQTNVDWDAVHHQGAQAAQSINGVGGYVKVKIGGSAESTRYLGLRTTAPDHTGANFRYYLQIRADGTMQVWENPGSGLVNVISGVAYAADDVIAFEAYDDAGVAKVRLTKNGALFATFTITTIFPMYFDTELPFGGTHLREGKIRRAAA
jgi:hypothetical protein